MVRIILTCLAAALCFAGAAMAEEACTTCGGEPRFPAESAFLESQGFPSGEFTLLLSWSELSRDGSNTFVTGYHMKAKNGRTFDLYGDGIGTLLTDAEIAALGLAPKNWNLPPIERVGEVPGAHKELQAPPKPVGPARAIPPNASIAAPKADIGKALQEDEQRARTAGKGAQRIGLNLALEQEVSVRGLAVSDGEWVEVPGTGWLWSMALFSPGALGMRVHFNEIMLPPGARVIVYNVEEPREAYGPYYGPAVGRDDLWSATVFADGVVVECLVPFGGSREDVQLGIDRVTHNYVPMGAVSWAKAAGACNQDVTCFSDWATTATSVGGVGSVGSEGSLWCTGALLADSDPGTTIPYFLTAAHCIGAADAAATLEVYWLYQTSSCMGTAPNPATVPRTVGGATLLATSPANTGTDFTLLRLNNPAAAGVAYAGWSNSAASLGAYTVGIHHPSGDYKRISFGYLSNVEEEWRDDRPIERYHQSSWIVGVTEPGSSGSPLFTSDECHFVIGQLWGGPSSCDEYTIDLDYYGRFDISYPLMQAYLGGVSPAPPNDAFAGRISITEAPTQVMGDSTDATAEPGEPAFVNRGGSVWWSWTAPETGLVALDTAGSDFDTVLGVYTGNSLGTLTTVAENDNSYGGPTSSVTFVVVAGTTYNIAVDGINGVGGNVVLGLGSIMTLHLITVSASPFVGGTVSGGNTYLPGTSVTVHAVANPGYVFDNWTQDGVPVSASADYTFTADSDRNLVANFGLVGATIGNSTVFGQTVQNLNRVAMPFTMPEAGTILSVSMYHDGGTGDMLLGVYGSGGDGLPGARLGLTAVTPVSGETNWQTIPLTSPLPVAAGQTVWLAWVYEIPTGVRYTAGSPGRAAGSGGSASGLPNPFGPSTQGNYVYSIFATYTPAPRSVQFGQASSSAAESVTPANLEVTLSAASGQTVTVDYAVTGGTATGGGVDYTLANGQLSFAPGQTSTPIPIEIVNDTSVEMNETIAVTLSNPVNAALGTQTTHTYTILDNDAPTLKTIGNTTVFGSTVQNANRPAMPFTMTEDGTIQSVSMYHATGTGNMLLAVYGTGNNGLPGPRLGVTATTPVSAMAGWQTIPLVSAVPVSAGTTIWLAWVYQNPVSVRYQAGTPGRALAPVGWAGGMPDPFGISTQGNTVYSIYANYVPGTPPSFSTIGNTTVFASTVQNANRPAMPFTMTESGRIESVSMYHAAGTGNMMLAVYGTGLNGLPGPRLGVTASTAVSGTAGWQTIPLLSPVEVPAGTTIWLAWVYQNPVSVRYQTGTPGRALAPVGWAAGMPDPFGTSTQGNTVYSIYANYIPTGTGSIIAWGENLQHQCDIPPPNSDFVAISAGDTHGLGLKSDGSIVAWGSNQFGQNNVPPPNTDFVAVAAGTDHSLGLKSDGSIVAWGINAEGECNVPPPNSDFVAIAAGFDFSLGLKQDGTVVAWGLNDHGQCNVPPPNSGFIAISAGFRHALGLKADGTVVAWGNNEYGQCNVPPPNLDFVSLDGGYAHSLGLKSNGSVVGWGFNDDGQRNPPVPNADFLEVSAGGYHSLGLKNDGSVVAWGRNDYGQTDVPLPNAGFSAISAAYGYSLGLNSTAPVPPATIGNTTVFSQTVLNAKRLAMPFTVSQSGNLETISMYHESGTGNMMLAVYGTGTGGLPGPRLGVTAVTPVSASAGWQAIPLTALVPVTTGDTIWLAWVYQNPVSVRYQAGTPGRALAPVGWTSGMPNPFGTSTQGNNVYSIHATYAD